MRRAYVLVTEADEIFPPASLLAVQPDLVDEFPLVDLRIQSTLSEYISV
ncbi:hypothetical protein [Salinibaculum salinum]